MHGKEARDYPSFGETILAHLYLVCTHLGWQCLLAYLYSLCCW